MGSHSSTQMAASSRRSPIVGRRDRMGAAAGTCFTCDRVSSSTTGHRSRLPPCARACYGSYPPPPRAADPGRSTPSPGIGPVRSEEHTSELQSRGHLVCRLLLEKKKKQDEQA